MTIGIKGPARYLQGKGELKNLGLNVKKLGSKFLVICSPNSEKRFGEIVEESIRSVEHEVKFSLFNGQATKAEVARNEEVCKAEGCDAVIGLGGGKVIDTAKAVADNLGLPCIVVPTAASNDAPCTGLAVLYNDEGVVIKALVTKRSPELILVDTEIIANAPARLFSAGIGDALATYFEARACEKAGVKTMARGLVSNTGAMMGRLCYDLLLKYGKEGLEAVKNKEVTPALENTVEASIYLSGVGFENGGLAVAHAVNDGFAHAPQCHDVYHGEKVAFGTIVQLVLEKNPEELREVLEFANSVELPITLEQLGMAEIDHEVLHKVAEAACTPKQSTKNLSPDITSEDVFNAILEADALGRECRSK